MRIPRFSLAVSCAYVLLYAVTCINVAKCTVLTLSKQLSKSSEAGQSRALHSSLVYFQRVGFMVVGQEGNLQGAVSRPLLLTRENSVNRNCSPSTCQNR